MLPTPDLSHLKSQDFEQVYEPAEDTFLLLDALEEELDLIASQRVGDDRTCIEVGSGSGCVSTFVARELLKRADNPDNWHFYCTDINPAAVKATRRTLEQNGIPSASYTVIKDNFCYSLESKLMGKCDFIIFNPPYVVTSSEELQDPSFDMMLSKAWAGGIDGREVIDDFLFKSKIPSKMLRTPGGSLYLVVINANRPEELIQRCREELQMKGTVLMKRKAGGEYLHILKLYF